MRFKVLGLSVDLRWIHFKSLKDYEGQKGGIILQRFKGLMCVGFVQLKFQALKNSWGQNSGGSGKMVGITMCVRNPIKLHCNLCN